jgi:hypothetical protein
MKSTKVFSFTDWSYHRGRVTWNDLFLDNGKFLATIATMTLAKEDGLFSKEWSGEKPRQVLLCDDDGGYTIYQNVPSFTWNRVKKILNGLGKLLDKKFVFTSGKPKTLPRAYRDVLSRLRKKEKWIEAKSVDEAVNLLHGKP